MPSHVRLARHGKTCYPPGARIVPPLAGKLTTNLPAHVSVPRRSTPVFHRSRHGRALTPAGRRCTYVAGYGDAAEDVPELIRTAVLNVVSGLYDQRGTLDNLLGVECAARYGLLLRTRNIGARHRK